MFPALFVGAVVGVLAANLPGLAISVAVPAAIAATVVSVLRLPLAASVITLLMTLSTGIKATPLVITAVVIGYITGELIRSRLLEPEAPEIAPET